MLFDSFFQLIFYLGLFKGVYERSKPITYDAKNSIQAKYVSQIPMQLCELAHAIVTSTTGILYFLGLIEDSSIFVVRIFSVAFFITHLYFHWKQRDEKDRLDIFLQNNGIEALFKTKSVALLWQNIYVLAFHHFCTVLFMYGVGFKSEIAGCVVFFMGEIPIALITINKILSYMGLQQSPLYMFCNWASALTYFFIRIVCFLLVFVITMLPYFNPFGMFGFAWVYIVFLFLNYLLNIASFAQLLSHTQQQFPFSGVQILNLIGLVLSRFYTHNHNPKNNIKDEENVSLSTVASSV